MIISQYLRITHSLRISDKYLKKILWTRDTNMQNDEPVHRDMACTVDQSWLESLELQLGRLLQSVLHQAGVVCPIGLWASCGIFAIDPDSPDPQRHPCRICPLPKNTTKNTNVPKVSHWWKATSRSFKPGQSSSQARSFTSGCPWGSSSMTLQHPQETCRFKPPIAIPSCLYLRVSFIRILQSQQLANSIFQRWSPSGRSLLCKRERDLVAALSAHSKVSKSTRMLSFSTSLPKCGLSKRCCKR